MRKIDDFEPVKSRIGLFLISAKSYLGVEAQAMRSQW